MGSSPLKSSSTEVESAAGPGPSEEDTELLAVRAREGDRAAFRRLYEKFAPMVHAVLIAGVRAHDADDLMQQVFLASWRDIGRLREPAAFGAWVAGIARIHVIRHHARGGPAPEALPESVPAPEARGGSERGDAILALLRALPEAYRETLAMRLVEGMSGPEIAAANNRSHGSVRVNLARGMKLLRAAIEREGV